jgi:soluble lytic murein transglycosylase-like protein
MFVFFSFGEKEKNIFFSYPEGDIFFAGENIPIGRDNYYNKQRFDKEFTISGNNLYQFYLYVKRYPLYIPYIEKQLKEKDIPNDFKYLPIAESALRNDVISSAGAAGIWQFMPETAKQYALRVDEFVDERYNFQKSTESAIAYLQELYRQFGDWSLVAASYNR